MHKHGIKTAFLKPFAKAPWEMACYWSIEAGHPPGPQEFVVIAIDERDVPSKSPTETWIERWLKAMAGREEHFEADLPA